MDPLPTDVDPLVLFGDWLDDAVRAGLREPNAAALATVGADGRPAVRMVLLKGFDERGLVFATHYESRKARELQGNASAAMTFWWDTLERQVRAEGDVEATSEAESDAIFAARPRGAQIGAWASPQSRPIADRLELERDVRELAGRWPGAVPRPPFWGGYRMSILHIEFWRGRPHRLHDRLRWSRAAGGGWHVERLAP